MSRKKQLEAKLSIKQREAALLLVERELGDESRTLDEIAQELGMSVRGLYKWRTQNKDFIDYVNLLADEFLESKRAVVYRQMMRLIEGPQPSVKALDLYMRRHGLLTDKQVVETRDASAPQSNDDIAKELEELDELLAEE
jgi:Helix-turn-helix of insertion element transposase